MQTLLTGLRNVMLMTKETKLSLVGLVIHHWGWDSVHHDRFPTVVYDGSVHLMVRMNDWETENLNPSSASNGNHGLGANSDVHRYSYRDRSLVNDHGRIRSLDCAIESLLGCWIRL